MIIAWGSYGLNKNFDNLTPVDFCDFCKYHGKMKCATTAGLAHFCYIPLFVHNRKYFLICPNCGNVIKISKQKFKDIKNGTWQPPIKDESLHVLTQEEVMEKKVTQEIKIVIDAQIKNLKNPEKQEATCIKIKKRFENKYKNNEAVAQMVHQALLTAIEAEIPSNLNNA